MNIQNRIGQYLQKNRSWYTRDLSTVTKITVHHDAIPHENRSADQIMQQIYNTHVNNGWPGSAYHFYIHRDGTVYQLNELSWVTWHDSINWDSVGIILTGYFHPEHNNKPTDEQLKSLRELLDHLCTQTPVIPADQDDVYGHRERGASTACPGDNLVWYPQNYRSSKGDVAWGKSQEQSENNNTSDMYKGIDLNNKESIKVCVDTWKDVIDGKYVKKEEYDKKESQYLNVKSELTACGINKKSAEDKSLKLTKEIEGLTGTIEVMDLEHKKEVKILKNDISKLKDQVINKNNEVVAIKTSIDKQYVKLAKNSILSALQRFIYDFDSYKKNVSQS